MRRNIGHLSLISAIYRSFADISVIFPILADISATCFKSTMVLNLQNFKIHVLVGGFKTAQKRDLHDIR